MNQYLVSGPVSPHLINTFVNEAGTRSDTGGHSIFLGQVRADEMNGRIVTAIEYSAYEPMVAAEAEKIIAGILSEFTDVRSIKIIHSTGLVKAGEISLLVFVSAGHRRQAIDACSAAVEKIKENLPVWKKEIFDDSSTVWKSNDPR